MIDFGELRVAAHAKDLRQLIELSYRKRRYTLDELSLGYINDILPEYEREIFMWAICMVDTIMERTSAPHVMVRAFASTWAEWMRAGAVGIMPVRLSLRDSGGIGLGYYQARAWHKPNETKADFIPAWLQPWLTAHPSHFLVWINAHKQTKQQHWGAEWAPLTVY